MCQNSHKLETQINLLKALALSPHIHTSLLSTLMIKRTLITRPMHVRVQDAVLVELVREHAKLQIADLQVESLAM